MRLLIVFLAAIVLLGQQQTKTAMPEAEQNELRQALAEAGNSPVDFTRALENHLARYPDSPGRPDLERALVKGAFESRDDERLIKYGERVLAREPDDAQMLERVTTALLRMADKQSAGRALEYASHFQEIVQVATNDKTGSGRDEAKLKDGADR